MKNPIEPPDAIRWLERQIEETKCALKFVNSLQRDFLGQADDNGKVYQKRPYLLVELNFDQWRHGGQAEGLQLTQSALSIVANERALALLESGNDWLLGRLKGHEVALGKLRVRAPAEWIINPDAERELEKIGLRTEAPAPTPATSSQRMKAKMFVVSYAGKLHGPFTDANRAATWAPLGCGSGPWSIVEIEPSRHVDEQTPADHGVLSVEQIRKLETP